jgi:CheY-like chemotaxis protein
VRRIQNFARRRMHESFARIDLRALVAETIEMTSSRWRGEANARGIRYTVRLEPNGGEAWVFGNDSELREVFVNFIFNSLDAMPDGGRIAIRIARERGFVVTTVEDTGCGMPEAVQRRVFEPFFTTKGSRGTGLGLAVSYGIVSRHDGRIEFTSRPGTGTTFTVALPALETRTAAATVERELVPLAPPRFSAEVLVVDDDETVCEVVVEALRERGHSVRAASGGHEALERMRELPARVVVTDLSMPEMNGVALARAVRRDWPTTRTVLMTGADLADVGPLVTGATDVALAKPFELDELCYVVETLAAAPSDETGRE